MLRKPALLGLSLLAAAAASAGTTTETVQFDYSPLDGTTELVLNGFDTQGGARRLRSATFQFNHNFAVDVFLESTGPTAVQNGDFGLSVAFISILQLGTVDNGARGDGGGGNNPPFFGPGGFFFGDISADLGAYDGVPGNDGPDSARLSFTEAYISNFLFNATEQPVLDALTDSGPLTTIYGGFGELGFYWNNDPGWPEPGGFFPDYPSDAAIWVSFDQYRHFGDFTITYRYTLVPGPTAAAPLALLALGLRRRRGV